MDNGRDQVMIACRAAHAHVLAEVLLDARRRSVETSNHTGAEIEVEREGSTVAIIDDVLRQLERPLSSRVPRRPVVLVVRDPDYENEFVVDGEVETIDVDLGSEFDGLNGFANLERDEQDDWARSMLANVAHLPAGSNVRRAVEGLVAEMAG